MNLDTMKKQNTDPYPEDDDCNAFTIEKLAERWSMSKSTIKRMIARKELRTYRIGPRQVRICNKDIIRYEQDRGSDEP
jgi:excisionase family DNA binding protein